MHHICISNIWQQKKISFQYPKLRLHTDGIPFLSMLAMVAEKVQREEIGSS